MNTETPEVKKDAYPSAEFVQKIIDNLTPVAIDVKPGTIDKTQVLVIPESMQVISTKPFMDALRRRPERRAGQHTAMDVDTFCDITNRFANENSVVFSEAVIQASTLSASLLAVLDFHPAGKDNSEADNGQHTVSYKFPISKELAFWKSKDGNEFNQTDFAQLLEDRIGEMGVADDAVIGQIRNLTPKFAEPLQILSLSRDLEIYATTKIRQAGKLQSGERKIEFEEAHVDATGKALSIPDFFLLQIPVFVGGPLEKIIVALRYRKKGEGVVWFYSLYRIDQVFQRAFENVVADVKEKTKLPVYLGRPAMSSCIPVGGYVPVDTDD